MNQASAVSSSSSSINVDTFPVKPPFYCRGKIKGKDFPVFNRSCKNGGKNKLPIFLGCLIWSISHEMEQNSIAKLETEYWAQYRGAVSLAVGTVLFGLKQA